MTIIYAGIEIEPIDLMEDPEYRKMVAFGHAVAKFEREIRREKANGEAGH